MGDVADIMGVAKVPQKTVAETAVSILAGIPKDANRPKKIKKPKGMSREVFDLMGPGGLTSSIETNKLSTGFKDKRVSATKGKWIWAPFKNSARGDDMLSHHWAKADVQYADYPYSKYNVKLEHMHPPYNDEEYSAALTSKAWTRSETDHLIYICYKYDLRWPVIIDRYESSTPRTCEELQARYLTVINKIKILRGQPGHHSHNNSYNNKEADEIGMDVRVEKNRRTLQDYIIRRTKEEENEINELKEKLSQLEKTLKQQKAMPVNPYEPASTSGKGKAGLSNLRSSGSSSGTTASGSGLQGLSPVASLQANIAHYEQQLKPGKPTLQSLRIPINENKVNLSKSLLKKMTSLLRDMGVPETPLPTKAVCDLLDGVRQSAVSLLSIQTQISKKEGEAARMRKDSVSAAQSGTNFRESFQQRQSQSSSGSTIPHQGPVPGYAPGQAQVQVPAQTHAPGQYSGSQYAPQPTVAAGAIPQVPGGTGVSEVVAGVPAMNTSIVPIIKTEPSLMPLGGQKKALKRKGVKEEVISERPSKRRG